MWCTPTGGEGLITTATTRPVIVFLGGSCPGRLLSVALIALCQAWSSSHIRHTNCQTGAYRTLNKRGHIPGVFPHEVTSCSRGKVGCWEFTGGSGEKDTSSAEGLISSAYVFYFSLPLHTIFIFLSICTSQSHCQCPPQWNYESWSEGLA